MLPQQPQIPQLGDQGGVLIDLGIIIGWIGRGQALDQKIHLGQFETGQRNIDLMVEFQQTLQLDGENFLIPTGQLG